jgi:hypothetical protein
MKPQVFMHFNQWVILLIACDQQDNPLAFCATTHWKKEMQLCRAAVVQIDRA